MTALSLLALIVFVSGSSMRRRISSHLRPAKVLEI
jgi:hypothetical protein